MSNTAYTLSAYRAYEACLVACYSWVVIRSVQALRAVAALLVVSVHLGNPNGFESRYLSNPHPYTEMLSRIGYLGVDLFFVISGFVMVTSALGANGRLLSAAAFLKRRVARIYPSLWIINTLVLIVFMAKPSLVNTHSNVKPDILASYLLLPQAGSPLVLVAWTLVFEMYFYLVFAFGLIWGMRSLIAALAGWAVITAFLHAYVQSPTNTYLAFVSNSITYEFLLGVLVGFVAMRTISKLIATAVLLLGMSTTVLLIASIAGNRIQFPEDWSRIAAAVPLALVVLGAVALERRIGFFTPASAVLLGDASYAMYLWHIPVLTILGFAFRAIHAHGSLFQFGAVFAAYAIVVFSGVLIYRNIERPLTTLFRRALESQSRARAPALLDGAFNPSSGATAMAAKVS
ncbi:MAG: acyltransferase [Candidatus Eremiobacteraeota bacterium]|nr:acyltransferase [Candidatus Eremiobacteraeota bacterium]